MQYWLQWNASSWKPLVEAKTAVRIWKEHPALSALNARKPTLEEGHSPDKHTLNTCSVSHMWRQNAFASFETVYVIKTLLHSNLYSHLPSLWNCFIYITQHSLDSLWRSSTVVSLHGSFIHTIEAMGEMGWECFTPSSFTSVSLALN